MRIILCHSVIKKELTPIIKYFSKKDVKKYVERVERGLGIEIKGTNVPETKIVKVYMTGKNGAGRMIVLIYVKKDLYLPIMIRLKNDKIVGENLSVSNPSFQEELFKNLILVEKDLREKSFEEM